MGWGRSGVPICERDRPIHCSPLDRTRFSAHGGLHRPPETSRDGPRAVPGPKTEPKSVPISIEKQVRTPRERFADRKFDGIGLDWMGLDRIGLAWIGLGRIGLDWLGLDWIGLGWVRLGWIGLGWIGLDWIGRD